MTPAELLSRLEAISRERPDRVLRLRGTVFSAAEAGPADPFELLIYRGFSSSTTHPTAFDPDQPVLPSGVVLESGEVLLGPLNPAVEAVLVGPTAPQLLLDPQAW
jgi:hypothetical protein